MAWETTARFKPRTWVALTALLLVPALGLSLAQEKRRCWEAADAETQSRLRRKAPSSNYGELFTAARDRLTKSMKGASRPSDKVLDEVILYLRAAVDYQDKSKQSVQAANNTRFDYTPYFYLALALAHQDKFELANECLELEADWASNLLDVKELLPRVEQLIATGLAEEIFLRDADAWSTWVTEKGSECLTPSEIEAAKRLGENAKGSDDQARTKFNESVINLVQRESKELRGKLTEFDSASAASCDALQAGATIETAQKRLVECCRATTSAMRKGGKSNCEALAGLKKQRENKTRALRAYGASPAGSTARLPAPCSDGADWSDLSFAELSTRIDSLDIAASMRSFESDIATIQAQLNQERQTLQQKRSAALSKIVVADAGCVKDLNLHSPNKKLVNLQRLLERDAKDDDPLVVDELRQAPADVERLLPELERTAKTNAAKLAKRQDEAKGIDRSKFAGLQSGLEAIQRGFNQASLDQLCKGARPAREADNDWWTSNEGDLEDRLADRRKALKLAGEYRPAAEPGSLECIDAAIKNMPRTIESSDQSSMKRARTSIEDAEACLELYSDLRNQWVETVTTDLEQMLGSLSEFSRPGVPFGDRIERSKQELQQVSNELGGQALELGDYSDAGAFGAQIEPFHAPLQRAHTALSTNRSFVEDLGSIVALTGAFDHYNRGDVDAAIESLRRSKVWQSESEESGSPTLHATMSYFLYAKHLALRKDDRFDSPSRLLFEDASAEARIARGIELPGFLKNRGTFETFFENQSSSE